MRLKGEITISWLLVKSQDWISYKTQQMIQTLILSLIWNLSTMAHYMRHLLYAKHSTECLTGQPAIRRDEMQVFMYRVKTRADLSRPKRKSYLSMMFCIFSFILQAFMEVTQVTTLAKRKITCQVNETWFMYSIIHSIIIIENLDVQGL